MTLKLRYQIDILQILAKAGYDQDKPVHDIVFVKNKLYPIHAEFMLILSDGVDPKLWEEEVHKYNFHYNEKLFTIITSNMKSFTGSDKETVYYLTITVTFNNDKIII